MLTREIFTMVIGKLRHFPLIIHTTPNLTKSKVGFGSEGVCAPHPSVRIMYILYVL